MKKSESATEFLADLVLLRNDPALLGKILPFAEAGNPHAQYAIGLIYAEGRGVQQDTVQAYIWLSRAVAQGDQDASLLLGVVMNDMSKEQIALGDRALSEYPLQ